LKAVEHLHQSYVLSRRVRVLASRLAPVLPPDARVLDVGCGDGLLAREILRLRPDVAIEGVDVHPREAAALPVTPYDGSTLPFSDSVFDAAIIVDVLHHADDPPRLLREAARVTRGVILIKDHASDRFLAVPTLRLMDRIGNARHGVALPYRYWRRGTWFQQFAALGMEVASWEEDLGLYPIPAKWIFGGSLHFLARLSPK
jgi:SAM-dependent methyltransferase